MIKRTKNNKLKATTRLILFNLFIESSAAFVIDNGSSSGQIENPVKKRKRKITIPAESQIIPSPSSLTNQQSPSSPPPMSAVIHQNHNNNCKNGDCTSTHLSSAATLELEYTDYLQQYYNSNETSSFALPSISEDYYYDEISRTASSSTSGYQIFCDLDGVLVDFEAGVQRILNRPTHQLPKHIMWQGIEYADRFFERLPWKKGGRKLWHAIKHLSPDILTGVPGHYSSRIEKYNWCRRELGLHKLNHVDMAAEEKNRNNGSNIGTNGFDTVSDHFSVNGNFRKNGVCNVITCWSLNKHHESHSKAILIDDRISLKPMWEAAGGIFVHHTDTDSTLKQLRDLGLQLKDDESFEIS